VLALAKQAVAAFQVAKTFSDVLLSVETDRKRKAKGITKTTAGGLIDTPTAVRTGSSAYHET
jgi:hypothetical protein